MEKEKDMKEDLNYKSSDTQGELARLMCLMKLIYDENMGIFKMFLGKKSDEIIKSYNDQFNQIDFYEND